jgi:hypothetical protein
MAKRIVIRTLLCLSILAIATVTLLAAGSGDGGLISFGGKPSWAMATTPSTVFQPVDPNPEKLFTIFSNLGTGRKVYTDNVGLDVAGPDSGVTEEWIAHQGDGSINEETSFLRPLQMRQ